MSIFDIILLIILLGFVWFGFWFGLIYSIGSLVGIIAGIYIAGVWYNQLAHWTLFIFQNNLNLARIVCFIIIFIIVNRLIGFGFYLINKIFKIISLLPFLKTINRLGGAIIGFFEGILVLGLILYLATFYPLWTNLNQVISGSRVAHYLIAVARILSPLLPKLLKKIKDII